MALIQNDIDTMLSNSAVRLITVANNYISLSASATSFNVSNGVASPTSITITAKLNGVLYGVPNFTIVSGASSISSNGLTATLPYTSLTADAATIRASLNYLGNSYTADITIGGQTAKPGNVTGFATSVLGTNLKLTWNANTDADIAGYEVRTTDANWGVDTAYTFKGSATNCTVVPKALGVLGTWYIRAYDTSGLYSAATVSTSYTVVAPVDTTDILYAFADTSLTSATVTLDWPVVAPIFGLAQYEVTGTITTTVNTTSGSTSIQVGNANGITIGDIVTGNASLPATANVYKKVVSINYTTNTVVLDSAATSTSTGVSTNFQVVKVANSTTIVLPATWLGNKPFVVRVIDGLGNYSAGFSKIVPMLPPNPVLNLKAQIVDNTVSLSWSLPARTTLPILYVIVKKSAVGGTWATATLVGNKSGEFTTIQELAQGTYIYWVAAIDTDGNESTPVSVTANVLAPPDFVFNYAFSSKINGFPGTKVNAIYQSGELVLPINASETWDQHFGQVSTATPNDQITAGNPVYVQPGLLTATYTEIFDYGQVLASSSIRVALTGRDAVGTTGISTQIYTSSDNVTYSAPATSNAIFATNFRYVKVVITATQAAKSIYAISDINVVLDTKLKTDAGKAENIIATDVGGSVVNFTADFIDIASVAVTPYSATGALLIPVYNFIDLVQLGTYTITSNVITGTIPAVAGNTAPHGLLVGQLVRLTSSAFGTARVIITSVPTANTFTAAITAANSSGSLTLYPNSMTIYLYNQAAARQSGVATWTVRGS